LILSANGFVFMPLQRMYYVLTTAVFLLAAVNQWVTVIGRQATNCTIKLRAKYSYA